MTPEQWERINCDYLGGLHVNVEPPFQDGEDRAHLDFALPDSKVSKFIGVLASRGLLYHDDVECYHFPDEPLLEITGIIPSPKPHGIATVKVTDRNVDMESDTCSEQLT